MPVANGVYKLAVIGTGGGQQHIHTLHFRSTIDPDSLAMTEAAYQQALIDAWQGAPATAYRAIFAPSQSIVQMIQCRKVCGSLPLPGGLDEAQPSGQQVGTRGGTEPNTEILAPWLASVVTVRTEFAGRSYRGRMFLGMLHEGDMTAATIGANRLTAQQGYTTALTTAFITPADVDTPFKLFVFSRVLANGKPATGTEPAVPPVACQEAGADVLSFQHRDQLASMRSRKLGSGI